MDFVPLGLTTPIVQGESSFMKRVIVTKNLGLSDLSFLCLLPAPGQLCLYSEPKLFLGSAVNDCSLEEARSNRNSQRERGRKRQMNQVGVHLLTFRRA